MANAANTTQVMKHKVRPPSVADLSFTQSKSERKGMKRRFFWNVSPTGDYGKDCDIGLGLAIEYLEFEMADTSGPGILPMIVGDMPKEHSGIEVGFLSAIGKAGGRGGVEYIKRLAAYWERCKIERGDA